MSIKESIAIVHNLTNGGALRVLEQTTALLSKKYQVKVFRPVVFKKCNNRIWSIVNYLKYLYYDLPRSYSSIAETINKLNIKAVLVHHDAYVKTPLVFRRLSKKTIYFLHEPPREFYEPLHLHAPLLKDKLTTLLRLPVKYIDFIQVRSANYVIVNSEYSKKKIDKLYNISSKVLYLGSSPVFKRINSLKKENQVVSVGSLLPYKGHDLTIKSLSLLKVKPKLIVVGSGRISERNKLEKLAQNLGVDIEIMESISDKKLNNIYNKSLLYINSAFGEPFGLSVLEALSAGTRVVTVNNCGTVELGDYFRSDVVVTSRDQSSISKAVTLLLKKKNHKKPQLPKVFSWKNVTKKVEEIIEK